MGVAFRVSWGLTRHGAASKLHTHGVAWHICRTRLRVAPLPRPLLFSPLSYFSLHLGASGVYTAEECSGMCCVSPFQTALPRFVQGGVSDTCRYQMLARTCGGEPLMRGKRRRVPVW